VDEQILHGTLSVKFILISFYRKIKFRQSFYRTNIFLLLQRFFDRAFNSAGLVRQLADDRVDEQILHGTLSVKFILISFYRKIKFRQSFYRTNIFLLLQRFLTGHLTQLV
jgi:hypothetical protein